MKQGTLKGIEWMFENEFNDLNNDNHAVNRSMLRTMLWEVGNYEIELAYDLDGIIFKARIFKKIYQTEGINNDENPKAKFFKSEIDEAVDMVDEGLNNE